MAEKTCEVCRERRTQRKASPRGGKLRRLLVGERIFLVCDEHAERIRKAGPETPEALRALFPEGSGRRSLVARRATLDRRMFPARPEGRRTKGRRAGDGD
ncbi:MAG TPA: hypothetical protein VHE30_13380 [Polyangiaceae bacterium]|nr:hypothetical protein [Polyangiaceae bacterium]